MNEQLKAYLERAKAHFDKYSKKKKILITVVTALVMVSTVIGAMILRNDPQQILYTDLHAEDSKAITKKLSEKNIPYHLSDDNATISVAASRVAEARMELAKEGLPGQDVVGFEKFDGSTLGMSSYIQRIQYVRAVQGELTRSIQRLASVKSARVHISVPPKKTFLEEDEPPKASVILELRTGQTPSKQEIRGIANLVASAVEGLKVSQVTIVDTKGSFLHHPEEENVAGVSSTLLEMQRSIEAEYEKRVEEILTPVIGFGKVRAKVTAEVDQSRVNTTEESYDSDKAIPRTINKIDEETTGSRPNPIGIPGSRSNLPGTETNNPGIPNATNHTEKHQTNNNVAIPRKVQITDKPSGSIRRLTVAVVVDGHYTKGSTPTEAETFTPRSEEELRRLQDLVANAVGYDAQRRDSITVSSLPFRNVDVSPPDEIPTSKFDLQELTKHGVRNGLIGLLILAFFFFVLRPFLKWTTNVDQKKELTMVQPALPKTVAELEAQVKEQQLGSGGAVPTAQELLAATEAEKARAAASSAAEAVLGETMAAEEKKEESPDKKEETGIGGLNKTEEEELKEKILERLGKFPKKGFRIVQDWIEESDAIPVEG